MLIQRLLQQGHPFREQELLSIRRYLLIMLVFWEMFKVPHQRKTLKKLSSEYTDIPSCYLLSTITIPKSQENPIDLMYTGRLDIDKEWSNAVRTRARMHQRICHGSLIMLKHLKSKMWVRSVSIAPSAEGNLNAGTCTDWDGIYGCNNWFIRKQRLDNCYQKCRFH